MPFELPNLKYSYADLKPAIDEKTMETHHSKHHAGYVKNLNAAIAKHEESSTKTIEELLLNLHSLPSDIIETVKNNGGGHYNHTLFWETLTPKQEIVEPSSNLCSEINNVYGNFENFKKEFTKTAMGRFGSGWAWLSVDGDGKIYISSNANQENPLMDGCTPVLNLDVWEHAYYLKYQNRRAEYIEAWWSIVDWIEVEKRFNKIKNS